MINSINGFNQNLSNYNKQPEKPKLFDKNELPEHIKNMKGAEYEVSKKLYEATVDGLNEMITTGLYLKPLPQSGYGEGGKITIWGKYLGFDQSMSQAQINDLRRFIDQTTVKPDGIASARNGAVLDNLTFSLLDTTDLSIDEFKEKYAQASQKLQERIDAIEKKNKEATKQLQDEPEKFKPIQAKSQNTKTYNINDDERLNYKIKLLQIEQNRGIDTLKLTQALLENGVDIKV